MKKMGKPYQRFRQENRGKTGHDNNEFERFRSELPHPVPLVVPAPDRLLQNARLRADEILKKRRVRRDGLLFMGTCLCLLAAAGGLLYSGGGLVLLGIEAFFALFFPIGIPLILIRRKKLEAEG